MTGNTRAARLRAYAKLNLGLRVLFRREDGYHELRTVFQTISLADQLSISFAPAKKTTVSITGTPEIADNLLERGARRTLETLKIHGDVRFVLKKIIPMGAGLGGGSSDAAAVLLALPVLAGRAIPEDQLQPLAAGLGSDVPFFLFGGTALAAGRGEELYPLPQRSGKGLIVAPAVHSSTAEAYRDLSATLTSIALQNKLLSFQREIWQGMGAVNDFEGVVFARHPELSGIKRRLVRNGAKPALMTGSGSSVFGLFENAEQLKRAEKLFPQEKVFRISFLSRAAYRSRWQRALSPHVKGDQWPPQSLYAR